MDARSQKKTAEALGNLAIELQAQSDPDATLRTIVSAASDIVPGISWAGVSLVQGKSVTPGAVTDDVARTLDQLQSDLGQGPAIDALAQQRTVVIPDLGKETRWPRFVKAAADSGVLCLAAFRLYVEREALGALTMYGPSPGVFDEDAVLYGEILAQHAAVAMAGARAEDQLQRAVASRDLIGQAKGIIMERFKVDPGRAFAMLTRLSQDSNTKLVQVAQRVVESTAETA